VYWSRAFYAGSMHRQWVYSLQSGHVRPHTCHASPPTPLIASLEYIIVPARYQCSPPPAQYSEKHPLPCIAWTKVLFTSKATKQHDVIIVEVARHKHGFLLVLSLCFLFRIFWVQIVAQLPANMAEIYRHIQHSHQESNWSVKGKKR
jgi:hypothetical protein